VERHVEYGIRTTPDLLIKSLYEMQQSNVRAAGGKSDWFNVMKGVRQGCLLSPYLFNIMCEGFEGGFRIGGRLVTNLRYADDIVLIASNEAELQELVTRLHWAACEMSMRINVKKTEVMKVDDDLTPIKVTVAGVYLRQVHSFKYLDAYFNSDATCNHEIKSRLAIGRERMAQLNTLWRSRAISNPLKARLIQALIWPIVTYGADAWTLNKELTGNIEAFEMQCYRRSMKVPYTEHVTNETILERVKRSRGLLASVKSHKLKHFGHTARHNSLAKDIMLGPMQGKRRQGGQRKQWIDDLREWTGLTIPDLIHLAQDRDAYRRFVHAVANAR